MATPSSGGVSATLVGLLATIKPGDFWVKLGDHLIKFGTDQAGQ